MPNCQNNELYFSLYLQISISKKVTPSLSDQLQEEVLSTTFNSLVCGKTFVHSLKFPNSSRNGNLILS